MKPILAEEVLIAIQNAFAWAILVYLLSWVLWIFKVKISRVKILTITFVCVLMFRLVVTVGFGYQLYTNKTNSMFPTLTYGDLIVTKRSELISRGDIVIFDEKDSKNNLISRVIGIPGDVVKYAGYKEIFVNNVRVVHNHEYIDKLKNEYGEVYSEIIDAKPYHVFTELRENIPTKIVVKCLESEFLVGDEIHVPDNHYLLFPDNRSNSRPYMIQKNEMKYIYASTLVHVDLPQN